MNNVEVEAKFQFQQTEVSFGRALASSRYSRGPFRADSQVHYGLLWDAYLYSLIDNKSSIIEAT